MMSILEGITFTQHYQLQQRLARGGMSEVYLAIDTRTNHKVAVKLVQRDHTEFSERFRREMYAVSELEHDHILPAFDYGEYGPWCYMVMPYIEQGTLRERLAQGPLSPKEAGAILEQIASALQFAHGRGIIHRDIKPSNILLRDGLHAYLSDFGLAKHLETDSSITMTGVLIGTPEYMAPELIDQPASISSDLYALGIVLYQMLTGRVPFKSTTPIGIYWKHLQELPPPPSTINPAIEPAIEQVLLHALEKDPQLRFQSAREFVQAYRNAINTHTTVNIRPNRGVTPPAVIASRLATHHTALSAMPPMRQKLSKKRIAALTACALLFLFALPMWLGFSLYSANHRSHAPTVFTMFPLWTDYPLLPVFPTKQNTPPTQPPPTPTPTPTPTVTTQSGKTGKTGSSSNAGNTSNTGNPATYQPNQATPPQGNGNNGDGNEKNNDGNKGQHTHGNGGNGGGGGDGKHDKHHKGKHKH